MSESKEQLVINATSDIEAAIWRIEDNRTRTLERIKDVPEPALEWHADAHPNSIGTLLYHIAAIEADWLFEEVIGEWAEGVSDLFPYDVRDKTGSLTVVTGVSLAEHLERLRTIRQYLLDTFQAMDETDYRQKREFPRYFVTPEWVVHHLCQHEAEHRGEITTILSLYKAYIASG